MATLPIEGRERDKTLQQRLRDVETAAALEADCAERDDVIDDLDAQLKEKRSQIRHYKAAVVRNDEKIERLLEQVVSRANRLGATGPVEVETIHVFQVS